MKRNHNGRLFATCAVLSMMVPCQAQVAYFDESTDTIRVDGQTVMGSEWTVEARVYFRGSQSLAVGRIFNEWTVSKEDKQLHVFADRIRGTSWPHSSLFADVTMSPNEWHHIAFVDDANEDRLYIDGRLVAGQRAIRAVGNGANRPFIGATMRGSTLNNSFHGYIDFLHVSSVARYSTTTFEPPTSAPIPDSSTLILFNFNEPPGTTVLIDESSSAFRGELGVGFSGATQPELVCGPNDCDSDGDLDIFDFLCFQNTFVNGDPYACDCDTSTGGSVCDIFDFLCFQSAFVAGCP